MLSQIRVSRKVPGGTDEIYLNVGEPRDGYGCVVREVDGLGPVQSNIRYFEYSELDGGTAAYPRVGVRNITIKVGFQQDYQAGITKEDVRKELYKLVQPSLDVRLCFIQNEHFIRPRNPNDTPYTTGYVESVEPNTWSRDPEVIINIVCLDPNIYLPEKTVFFNTDETFSLEIDGDSPVGFKAFSYVRYSSEFTFENLTSEEKLVVKDNFDTDELVQVSTVPGNKLVQVRNSDGYVDRRLWDSYTLTNGWPMLYPGFNRFSITHDHHVPVEGELSYSPAYKGL